MAKIKKTTKTDKVGKPPVKSPTKPSQEAVAELACVFSPCRRVDVSLVRTINLGNFESVKVGMSLSTNIKDDSDLSTDVDSIFGQVEALLEEKIDQYSSKEDSDEEEEDSEEEDSEEEEEDSDEEEEDSDEEEEDSDEEEEDSDEEEEDVTEEDIRGMSKKELVALIKSDDDLDIDTSLKLSALRDAVLEGLFEEEEEEEGEGGTDDGDWDDEEWDDEEWEDEDEDA